MLELYDKLVQAVPAPCLDESLVDLLQRTWNTVSISHCASLLENRCSDFCPSDLVRLELKADDVRSAVYSNMMIWRGTRFEPMLNEWMSMALDKQNELLIEAFPSNRMYGVS